jgi:TetR/AcrR family tetracycline transcriptional repressor
VLAEQQPRPDAAGFDLAAFRERHPNVVGGIAEYFAGDRTVDDLFRDCVRLVVGGR